MEVLRRIVEIVDSLFMKIANFFVFTSASILVVSVIIQVTSRYIFNNSPRWTTELCSFMLVYMVFWGATIALHDGLHVAMDISNIKMPVFIRKVFGVISAITVYLFIIVIFYYGLQITIMNANSLSEALKIPYALVYVNLPVTSAFMAVAYTSKLMRSSKLLRSSNKEVVNL